MPRATQLIMDGWDALRRGEPDTAEKLFGLAAEADPGQADAWNGLGAAAFEKGDLERSLQQYTRARSLALEAYGTLPERLSWTPEHKPLLRALHGIGLNLFRQGRFDDAKKAFEELLRLNPDDNQGARLLLEDIKKKKKLWKQ
jgi:tetratricopeptide (TPR) repeat protein